MGDLGGHLLFAVGAFGFAGFVCWGLWRGEFAVRNGPTFTRRDNPVVYGILATVFSIIAIVFVLIALAVLFGG